MSRIGESARKPGELAAYFELHIEQGPYLHNSGTPIGVVTGITGRAVFEVEIEGKANHAGTTPMPARHDPLKAAARVIAGLELIAQDQAPEAVTTVGMMEVRPIQETPSRARFSSASICAIQIRRRWRPWI